MSFTSAVGQKRAGARLAGILRTGRVPSALLFYGVEGCGKTLVAHDFARALLCSDPQGPASPCGSCSDCAAIARRAHPDVKAVNAAYQAALRQEEPAKQRSLRVETIRHLRRDMELQSLLGRWKVAVIEDAHTLEIEASNALLKILEEPPPLTLWILVTAQREALPKTVLSRCFSIPFAPLPEAALRELLAGRGLPAERAELLAGLADGSMSRALQLDAAGDLPDSLLSDPLAPFSAADALPRELYLQRTQVELALFSLAQRLRREHLDGRAPFARVERAFTELLKLRQSLRQNAEPRLVLTLGALEAQAARSR